MRRCSYHCPAPAPAPAPAPRATEVPPIFHPLEVVKAATLNGAKLLHMDRDLGTVAIGKVADLVVVAENPINDFKVLYATGHPFLDRGTGKMTTTTGIRYTIKAGVVFDAQQLRQQVRNMVSAKKGTH